MCYAAKLRDVQGLESVKIGYANGIRMSADDFVACVAAVPYPRASNACGEML